MWVVNAKDAEGARSFRKGSLPGTGSLKLQRSIATSQQRTGAGRQTCGSGGLSAHRCVVPAKAGNSRFETGFLVPARVALRNTRARRGVFLFGCVLCSVAVKPPPSLREDPS